MKNATDGPVLPASCVTASPGAFLVGPGETVAELAGRIRASRCGQRDRWMWSPEDAARQMILARDVSARLAAGYP